MIYAMAKKTGVSSLYFNTWNELYENYTSFCNTHQIPKINSDLLMSIVDSKYYEMKYKGVFHYFLIKTKLEI